MKSLEELKALREKMQKQMNVRDAGDDTVRILVGMATCGIAKRIGKMNIYIHRIYIYIYGQGCFPGG